MTKAAKTKARQRAAVKAHAAAGDRFIREYLRQSGRLPKAK